MAPALCSIFKYLTKQNMKLQVYYKKLMFIKYSEFANILSILCQKQKQHKVKNYRMLYLFIVVFLTVLYLCEFAVQFCNFRHNFM